MASRNVRFETCIVWYFYFQPSASEPVIEKFDNDPLQIKNDYLPSPKSRVDLLAAPSNFPLPVYKYCLSDLTLVWDIYGGKDFGKCACYWLLQMTEPGGAPFNTPYWEHAEFQRVVHFWSLCVGNVVSEHSPAMEDNSA